MSEKILKMHHKKCDYTCMWNGIEDLYERRTGSEVPDYFFFCLSGIGNFIYLKFNQGKLRRMASWSNGRTKKMYQSTCDTIGFTYKYIEGRSFEYTLKKAKEQIDKDAPVVLGCLDMYYLHYYPKFYHKAHIPIHYILMVGYNDEEKCVFIQDCGLADIQKLTYSELEKALNIEKTELSDKNAICCIDFTDNVKDIREIALKGFAAKAKEMLKPEIGFIGIPGMRKLAKEIAQWPEQLTKEEYRASLMSITEFTGAVPLIPDKLRGHDGSEDIKHCADRDWLGNLLVGLGERYKIKGWIEAGKLFLESGDILQEMTEAIVEYLLGNRSDLDCLPAVISRVADMEEEAYILMADIQ